MKRLIFNLVCLFSYAGILGYIIGASDRFNLWEFNSTIELVWIFINLIFAVTGLVWTIATIKRS